MELEEILLLAMKVLGCAVGIYFIAGFIVSKVRLLPILAILSSIGTIVAVACIRNSPVGESLLWIPVVTALMTQLFYQGEGYMNPKIHENVYELISVERKYNSLFEDFDDYELHFSPKETGGFIENTIFGGLVYIIYFGALTFTLPNSWIVYIIPIYLLCMSIIDLLMVLGVINISAIVYNLGRIAVIMLAVIIGLLGGSNEKGGDGPASTDELRTKKMYDACAEFVKFDFTRSYEFAFEDCTMQNYEYVPHTEKRFIYDAEYLVGAEYTGVGADKRYSTFYISSDEFNGKTAQLNNNGGPTEDFNLIFVRYVEEVGGAFKYSTVEALDYASHCGFTAQQFDHAVQITYNSNEDYIHVLYQSKHDTSYTSKKHYQVSYHFNTDSEGNPVSLRSIECNIFTDDNTKQRFVYKPIYEPTGFEDLFDMYGNLDGYFHNDDVIYGIDFAEKFSALDSACWGGEYDFIFTEKSDYGSTAYIYDSESGLVAEYKDENYERGIAAAEANDFETSMPDYFISNADKLKYYPSGDVVVDDGNRFRKYTYGNYDAYLALGGVFDVYFAPDGVNAEEFASGSVTLTIGIHHPTFEEEIEQFRIQLLRISTGSYYVNAVHFDGIYEGKEYSIDVHVGYDKYDITMPESVAVG